MAKMWIQVYVIFLDSCGVVMVWILILLDRIGIILVFLITFLTQIRPNRLLKTTLNIANVAITPQTTSSKLWI